MNTGKIKTDQGAAVADFTELNLLKTLSNNVSHDSMWDINNQWLKQIQSRSSWWVFNIMDKIPNISKYSGLVKEGKRFIFLFVRLPALKLFKLNGFEDSHISFQAFLRASYQYGVWNINLLILNLFPFVVGFFQVVSAYLKWCFFLHKRKHSENENTLLQGKGVSGRGVLHPP